MDSADSNLNRNDAKSYALSGKIMLIAIIVLFFVVIIMVCLHMYARWYLLHARRRQPRRNRRNRRTQLFFYVDPAAPTALPVASRGLDASVISSLPVLAYSLKTYPKPIECAVCLSEFEEGDTGRVLPKCNHTFHIDCIDMWFLSHSTCPLCRAPVEPAPAEQNRLEVAVAVPEPGSSSVCAECHYGGDEHNRAGPAGSSTSSSSIGFGRKPSSLVSVAIEVPTRNESFGDESGVNSPSTPSSFRSPMSRVLSFTRILGRDRKASVSPSSGCGVGCSSTAELDAERGGREETQ